MHIIHSGALQSIRTEGNKTPSEIEKQMIKCLCSLIMRQTIGNKCLVLFSYGWVGERICLSGGKDK